MEQITLNIYSCDDQMIIIKSKIPRCFWEWKVCVLYTVLAQRHMDFIGKMHRTQNVPKIRGEILTEIQSLIHKIKSVIFFTLHNYFHCHPFYRLHRTHCQTDGRKNIIIKVFSVKCLSLNVRFSTKNYLFFFILKYIFFFSYFYNKFIFL